MDTAHQPLRTTFRIIVVYMVLGGAWILFSDQLLGLLVTDPHVAIQISIAKGWFFIALTAGLLWWMIHANLAREHASAMKWKASEAALSQVNRELQAISSCTQALIRADDETALLNDVCRIICEKTGYRMAWVGFAAQDAEKLVVPVGWSGSAVDYLKQVRITWADEPSGRGPVGTCIRTAQTSYVQNYVQDPSVIPWRESALINGFRSAIALPLLDEQGRAFGALTIYAANVHAFFPQEIRLMEELARDLAFGVLSLRSRAERKRAEEQVRQSEARLRMILDVMPLSVAVSGAGGAIEYLNLKMVETFGYCHEDIPTVARWLEQAYPDESYRRENQAIWETLIREAISERRAIKEREYQVTCKDGTVKTARIFGVPVAERLFVLFEDVTQRRHLEARLRQSEKMDAIGQLAGGIAHDFNNQLSGIVGFTELLLRHVSDPNLSRYAENIMKGACRSADLTKQLLAFSRSGNILSVPVNVHELIDETVAFLERSIDKQVVIERHLDASLHHVLGDPSQLQNALLNLAINARDAMPNGGTLSFSTTLMESPAGAPAVDLAPGTYVLISVTDTGCGMTHQVMSRMFEPFFTTKAPGKGTGLGLAAVYATMKNHRGDIQVHSRPGHGTTFMIRLPIHTPKVAHHPSGLRDIVPGSARILIIDDEPAIREVMTLALEEQGNQVTAFGDGEPAISFYQQSWQTIDLVVLDLIMPRMSGRTIFAALRAINPQVRVLLASGFSLGDDAQAVLNDGAVGFIQKPFGSDDLAKAVHKALSAKPER